MAASRSFENEEDNISGDLDEVEIDHYDNYSDEQSEYNDSEEEMKEESNNYESEYYTGSNQNPDLINQADSFQIIQNIPFIDTKNDQNGIYYHLPQFQNPDVVHR